MDDPLNRPGAGAAARRDSGAPQDSDAGDDSRAGPRGGRPPGLGPEGDGPAGPRRGAPVLGDGVLSPEAEGRLARGAAQDNDLALPDLSAPTGRGRAAIAAWRATIAAWRAAQHAAWGEGTVGDEPHHRVATLAGVGCLLAGPGPPGPPGPPDRSVRYGRTGRPDRPVRGGKAVGDGQADRDVPHSNPGQDAPTVLYLHGGGFVLGSAGVAAPITARLAGNLDVVSVDYRLAPEHPFPAGLEDALAVYRLLAERGPVVLMGDSAGAGLAVCVALLASPRPPAVAASTAGGRASSASATSGTGTGTGTGAPRPAGLVLLCPFLDHTSRPGAPLSRAYRGGTPPDHPLVSPLGADLSGLAGVATLVQTGSADPLSPQAIAFARRARHAGADVSLDVWQGMWHTWQYHRELPEAHQALAEAAHFAARCSRRPSLRGG